MIPIQPDKIYTQTIRDSWISDNDLSVDVLRLDELHPVVSGNKYFKLKHYLADALFQKKETIATFGGAFSNHIVATAYACKTAGLRSIGIIRGEKTEQLSHTLQLAELLGMELKFVSREAYRDKKNLEKIYDQEGCYWVNEGGLGEKGALGAKEILQYANPKIYNYIIAAVGTGTMLSGLIAAAAANQKIIGISSMKGNGDLDHTITMLLKNFSHQASFSVLHDYHFGGYAKHPPQLIDYMIEVYRKHQLPLDMVYTAKAFFAMEKIAAENYFDKGSKILFIHSGGLQGNLSLPPHVLPF